MVKLGKEESKDITGDLKKWRIRLESYNPDESRDNLSRRSKLGANQININVGWIRSKKGLGVDQWYRFKYKDRKLWQCRIRSKQKPVGSDIKVVP